MPASSHGLLSGLALGLALLGACGGGERVTAARLVVDLDAGVVVDQLRIQVVRAGVVVVSTDAPARPGAVASGADVVILFADGFGGAEVTVLVAGMKQGAQSAAGSGAVTLVRGQTTPIHVRLTASACAAGSHACTTGCYPDDDLGHCGLDCRACPAPPVHGQAACRDGVCVLSCAQGYATCGDACVDVTSDGAHCGGCDRACRASEVCQQGRCEANPCAAGAHPCGGSCVADVDVATCGSRCSPCPAVPGGHATCDGTSCGAECGTGFHACGGACESTLSVEACGTRCTPCPTTLNGHATCDGVACQLACDAGHHACGGICVSDAAVTSCGSSCTPCPAPANGHATCVGGACGVACETGYQLCAGACLPSSATCGATWALRATTGPSVRSTQMAYDSQRGVTVLFGGYNGSQVFDDTWEWNGSSWTQRTVDTRPSGRSAVTMGYDPVRHQTILFGGADGVGAAKGDTWAWDGTAWTQVATGGPDPRLLACMDWDPVAQVLLLFGGTGPGVLGDVEFQDVWAWNGGWVRWLPSGTLPAGRYGGACFVDVAHGGGLVVFGGAAVAGNVFAETWILQAGAWRLAASGSPAARVAFSGVFVAGRDVGLVFGGQGSAGEELNDTWTWNGSIWQQLDAGGGITPRAAHGMAYDSGRGVVVVFGGAMASAPATYSAETWELTY